jgi:superfamily II DNA/RNA helicase
MLRGIDKVAAKALQHFEKVLHPQAVRIFTPFTNPVPLSSCKLTPALKRFLAAYEPKVETSGLFPHQADFLKAYCKDGDQNFIVTTATGSGKSLCFLAWVFDQLAKEKDATALLCFPTQALMWGQAERLVRLSDPKSLARPGGRPAPYGGAVKVGRDSVGWTIWHGKGIGATFDCVMDEHEKSSAFATARVRIATLDKAHWSLFASPENKNFVARLRCLLLDEAHTYDGVFGANVHYFLKRVYLAREVLGKQRPGLFLASATLSSARQFAATLLSVDGDDEVTHIEDSTKQRLDLIPTADVPKVLADPPGDGLLRIVLLLNDQAGDVSLLPFMGNEKEIGADVNAIYFSQSKYMSKRLKLELEGKRHKRSHVIYDADLPPKDRREMERRLNDPAVRGTTVLATSALELGVDIEGLDVCLMDQIPPRRADLLQRIGRVGRRQDRPGLVLLRVGAEPHDQSILENPRAAFRLDQSRPMPVPVHLEMLKWRHMLAAFSEWMKSLKYRDFTWDQFNEAMERHFGEAPTYQELKSLFADRYSALVDMSGNWVHRGFRASASQGKIPLREGDREVARIEDIALFRDAHPEAVFLGHDLNRYRVVGYDEDWKKAVWEHPDSDTLLWKWLRAVKAVQVRRESRRVTTRGSWDESFTLYEVRALDDSRERPRKGKFEFGIWDYSRKWQGYTEIDLATQAKRKVTLAQVSGRFKEAIQRGERFPYLHEFSYRTLGWEWYFGALPLGKTDVQTQGSLGQLTGSILEHFVADAAQSRVDDFGVNLELPGLRLQVLDATPGGNGLSEALLTEGRMEAAFQTCIRTLGKFSGKGGKARFKAYVLGLCHQAASHSAEEVLNVVGELHLRWTK